MARRSRYAAVNERRRKARWNRRSLGQKRRYAKTRHGMKDTGYLRSLMTDREEILREEREAVAKRRAEEAHPEVVPVSESYDGRNAPYVRSAPTPSVSPLSSSEFPREVENVEHEPVLNERGEWVARGKAYRYKSEALSALNAD